MITETKRQGPFYEDFTVGQTISHANGRTLTDADNIWFSLLTLNTNPIHFNKLYTEENYSAPPFNGRLVVNSMLVLSVILGISVDDTSKYGVMLGLTDLKVVNPTFAGDTLFAKSEVLEKRESKSHEGMGIVKIRTQGFKNEGIQVIEYTRTFMVRKTGEKWK